MISIIIPVYNTALYLDKCIESVLNQTYHNFECILVDDGSTDNSLRKCQYWSLKDSRIKVFHQKNQGVSVARNKGINVAKGEYITFIDSDDWVEVCYLEHMREAMLQHSVDLVISGFVQKTNNSCLHFSCDDKLIKLSSSNINEFVELNKKFLLYGPCVKLYKSQIVKKNSIEFPSQYSYGEDLIFNYCYLNCIKSLYVIDRVEYNYRILGSGTLSTINRENQFQINYEQWNILNQFYETHGMINEISRNYLYDRLWWSWYDAILLIPIVMKNKSFTTKMQMLKQIMSIKEKHEILTYSKQIDIPAWLRFCLTNNMSFILLCILELKNKKK